MLHLLVPQSITPLIWAYLVFSLHMPFAPFWPSASIHPSIFLFSQRLTQPYTIVLVNENRLWYTNTHTHTHMHTTVWLTRADLVPEALIYFFFFFYFALALLLFINAVSLWKHLHAHTHTHTTTQQLLTAWTLAAGSAEGLPNLQVKRARENAMTSECFQSCILYVK